MELYTCIRQLENLLYARGFRSFPYLNLCVRMRCFCSINEPYFTFAVGNLVGTNCRNIDKVSTKLFGIFYRAWLHFTWPTFEQLCKFHLETN